MLQHSPIASLFLLACTGLAAASEPPPLVKDASGAPVASAAPATPPAASALPERLAFADNNGDGALDRDEAGQHTPRLAKRFDQIDSDADGKLSPDELDVAIERMMAKRR